MSPLTAGLAWVRRRLRWSNSPQSWIERGVGSALLAVAASLIIFGVGLPAWQQTVLWALVLLATAVVLRRGWLKLFGPVLAYDMVRSARRRSFILIRCLYAVLLLTILGLIYASVNDRHASDRQKVSYLADYYFQTFMAVQLGVVVLLTPAYLGGAIAEEKERKTLEFLLATDLRNREIVLGKLASRLGNLTLVLLTALPILSFLQLLGGIDPNLVLMGFAVALLTMFGIASGSLLLSVLLKTPRDAIALCYLLILVYLLGATVAWQLASVGLLTTPVWFGSNPPTVATLANIANRGNPFLLAGQIMQSGAAGTLATTLPTLLRSYAGFHVTFGVACLALAVARLRTVALRQSSAAAVVRRRGGRVRKRRPVGDAPMLWKELHVRTMSHGCMGWAIGLLVVALTLGSGLMIFWEFLYGGQIGNERYLSQGMNIWARIAGGGMAIVVMLAVAVRGSNSVSGERDKETFDALITTQIDSDRALGAKLVGCLWGARMGALLLLGILLMALFTGGLHPFAIPLFFVGLTVYSCLFAMVGLYFSIVLRSSTRATIATVMSCLFLGGGHWLLWFCCMPCLIGMGPGSTGANELLRTAAIAQAGLTPSAALGFFSFSPTELQQEWGREPAELLAWSIVGMGVWMLASAVLWFGALLPRFRRAMRREESYDPAPFVMTQLR